MKKMIFLSIALFFGFSPLQSSFDDGVLFNAVCFGILGAVVVNYLKTTAVIDKHIQVSSSLVQTPLSSSRVLVCYSPQKCTSAQNLPRSISPKSISPVSIAAQSPASSSKHDLVKSNTEQVISSTSRSISRLPSVESLSRSSSISSLVKSSSQQNLISSESAIVPKRFNIFEDGCVQIDFEKNKK